MMLFVNCRVGGFITGVGESTFGVGGGDTVGFSSGARWVEGDEVLSIIIILTK